MKYSDKTTLVECDGCHRFEAARFFEITADSGGQVEVWYGYPANWMSVTLPFGDILLACSPDCACDLSKKRGKELIAIWNKDVPKSE